jgi:hypothetical protein
MIHDLPPMDLPLWLESLLSQPRRIMDPFPARDVLSGSLFYPCCALDGAPVKRLGGNVLSFVYVDYGVPRKRLLQELKIKGFLGYELLTFRELYDCDLVPPTWIPPTPTEQDGRLEMLVGKESACTPYAIWTIWKRQHGIPASHGPCAFSFLFAGVEGCAYASLFGHLGFCPLVVAVIQPGHALGNNWTNIESPRGIFRRTLEGNPSGLPRYLLYGGDGPPSWYRQACWPDYSHFAPVVRSKHRTLEIWKHNEAS